MRPLLRSMGSEFLKILTTRMWWVLALVMLGYVGAAAGGLAALFGYISEHPEAATGGSGGTQALPAGTNLPPLVYSFGSSIGYVFPVLLGALASTGEFRHATLTPTFLATPRRGVVLLAKVKVLFVVGAVFGVIAFAGSIGGGATGFSAFGIDTALDSTDTWALAGRGILAMAIWAAIGVGLGTVVTSQVAAIVIVLAFTQFIEPLLRLAAGFIDVTANIARFLPGAASDSLVGASFFSITGSSQADPLGWWVAALVLAAYAAVFSLIGYLLNWRKDVT